MDKTSLYDRFHFTLIYWFNWLYIFQTGGTYEDDYPPLPAYHPESEPETREVYIVQVKGLPWSCTTQDLLQFFSGGSLRSGLYFVTTQYMNKLNKIIMFCIYHVPECRIRDGVKGIHLTLDRLGRPSGRAFIEMEHEEDVSKALEKHRQYLGPRYVEGLFQTGSPWQQTAYNLFIINKKQSCWLNS